jgi:hypothetical protein
MKPNHEPNSLTRISRARFLTALSLAALMTLPALAQDKEKDKHKDHPKDEKKGAQSGQPNEADMMAMMMEMAKPGENHKMLSQAVGQWTYKVKAWMSPDPNAAPQESSGTSVTREVMGGRYYITDHSGKFQMPGGPDGKMIDMDFKGMAVEGYDNAKKKFMATWIDNMGTGIMALEGDYDAASKSFTYHGEYEMMPGTKTKVREVIKVIDKDHRVFEWYEDRGGSEAKTMEMTYTRKT